MYHVLICRSYLDAAAFVKAKINNSGVIALGYTQSLRPGVKAAFGLALDTQKLNEASPVGPSHKVSPYSHVMMSNTHLPIGWPQLDLRLMSMGLLFQNSDTLNILNFEFTNIYDPSYEASENKDV